MKHPESCNHASQCRAKIKGFMARFEPEHQALIRSVRRTLRKRFPSADDWSITTLNAFVIAYSPTERGSDASSRFPEGRTVCVLSSLKVLLYRIQRKSSSVQADKLGSFD